MARSLALVERALEAVGRRQVVALLAEIERERVEATAPEVLEAAEEILRCAGRPASCSLAPATSTSRRSPRSTSPRSGRRSASPSARSSARSRVRGGHPARAPRHDADPSVQRLPRRPAPLRRRVRGGRRRPRDRGPLGPEHASVLTALCRNAREPAVAERLERFLKKALGAELVNVAVALRPGALHRTRLRALAALRAGAADGRAAAHARARALSRRSSRTARSSSSSSRSRARRS
jgi:hypothetical protein